MKSVLLPLALILFFCHSFVSAQVTDTVPQPDTSQTTYVLLEQEDYFVLNRTRGAECVLFNYVYTFPENMGMVVFTLNGNDFFAIENVGPNTMEGEYVGRYYKLQLENTDRIREGRAYLTNKNPGVAEKEGIIGFLFSYEPGTFGPPSTNPSDEPDAKSSVVMNRQISNWEYEELKKSGFVDIFQKADWPEPGGITKVYPNPTSGFVQVIYQAERSGQVEILVFDQAGRLVVDRRRVDALEGENNYQLELSGLADGVYKVIFQQENIRHETFVAKRLR